MKPREAHIKRVTNETRINLKLNLDGKGKASVRTGVPFFDHMLTLFAKHSVMDLTLRCAGDIEVDAHHTVEDCGIALGYRPSCRRWAMKESGVTARGLTRKTPSPARLMCLMDECLARCVVDFSGRAFLVWRGLNEFSQKGVSIKDKHQDMSSVFRFGLAREFFQGFANEARCNLHLELLYGDEPHHIVEVLFKAFARAVDAACRHDPRIAGQLPSTKGKL